MSIASRRFAKSSRWQRAAEDLEPSRTPPRSLLQVWLVTERLPGDQDVVSADRFSEPFERCTNPSRVAGRSRANGPPTRWLALVVVVVASIAVPSRAVPFGRFRSPSCRPRI